MTHSRRPVDGCLYGLEGDAKLCKRTGGKRVRNAEHPNQDVLVSHRTITGLVDRAVKRQLQTRRDAADTTARLIEHASANLPEGPATERLFQLFAHLLEVDPNFASASASMRGAQIPAKNAESVMSARVTPSWRRTRVAPPSGSRVNASSRCSVPT